MSLAMQTICRATAGSLAPGCVQDLLANGGQLVDVRSPADFRRNSLPGALNLPVDALCYEHRQLNSRRPVIVYGASEVRSARAARLLAGKGFSRIYHLAESQ
jgi:rhodanese-related sulfurtransferase